MSVAISFRGIHREYSRLPQSSLASLRFARSPGLLSLDEAHHLTHGGDAKRGEGLKISHERIQNRRHCVRDVGGRREEEPPPEEAFCDLVFLPRESGRDQRGYGGV